MIAGVKPQCTGLWGGDSEIKRFQIHQQVTTADQIEAYRPDTLQVRLREPVMVAKQMQPRLHRGEHVVDWRLPRINRTDPEGPRRFVGEQDVDLRHAFAGLDFLTHEMPASIGKPGGLGTALFRVRQRRGRRVIPVGANVPPSPATRR